MSWYDCPEYIDTSEWKMTLTPGTWYLAVLPWSGAVGDAAYNMELEY